MEVLVAESNSRQAPEALCEELGIPYVQGFGIARPRSIRQFSPWSLPDGPALASA